MIPTIVLNLAYIALVGSTFTRTVVWLRVMILMGSVCFITYGLLAGIPSMVFWNVLTGSLHVVNLARIARTRRATTSSPTEEWFRVNVFDAVDGQAFNAIWSGGRRSVYTDQVLTRQNVRPGTVAVIVRGLIDVYVDDRFVQRLGPGSFLGEMSYVSGHGATAVTVARGQVDLHEWDVAVLESLGAKELSAVRAFEQAVMRSLVTKMSAHEASSAQELAR